MKNIFLIAGILMLFSFTKQLTSESVLQKMYNRYGGKWFKTLSFNQTAERCRNDSLVKTETWYENVLYPSLFRIDLTLGFYHIAVDGTLGESTPVYKEKYVLYECELIPFSISCTTYC